MSNNNLLKNFRLKKANDYLIWKNKPKISFTKKIITPKWFPDGKN